MERTVRQTEECANMLSKIRSRLASTLDPRIYDLWFASGNRLQMRDGALVVLAESDFELSRIRRIYGSVLQSALRAEISDPIELCYELGAADTRNPNCKSVALDKASAALSIAKSSPLEAVADLADRSSTAKRDPAAPVERKAPALKDFCFGQGNELVRVAIDQLIAHPGRCSPLVIYGPPGSGKTHLLEAAVARMRRASRFGRCHYVTAEEFTNSFLELLRGSGLPMFRKKYRDLQLLAIDDVQFFSGKRATIAELQYTLDHLARSGKQLLIACDRPPSELSGLGPEIVARLNGGLVCPLAGPPADVRRQLIQRFCQQRQFELPAEIVEFLADRLPADARRLNGALNRVHALQLCRTSALTIEDCRLAIRDLSSSVGTGATLPKIERAVCDCCGVEPGELRSENRSRRIAAARMLAMWLSRRHTPSALSEIGDYFGGRSHSAVIAAQKKVDSWLSDNPSQRFLLSDGSLREAIGKIEQRLQVG